MDFFVRNEIHTRFFFFTLFFSIMAYIANVVASFSYLDIAMSAVSLSVQGLFSLDICKKKKKENACPTFLFKILRV